MQTQEEGDTKTHGVIISLGLSGKQRNASPEKDRFCKYLGPVSKFKKLFRSSLLIRWGKDVQLYEGGVCLPAAPALTWAAWDTLSSRIQQKHRPSLAEGKSHPAAQRRPLSQISGKHTTTGQKTVAELMMVKIIRGMV